MSKIRNNAFRRNTEKYDEWFERNLYAYESELLLLQSLNMHGRMIEIGVGTGKFAFPLGIKLGVEPTEQMYKKAVELGIDTICAVAENLPLRSDTFDWVLMVTTICFVNDPQRACDEMFRILNKGGHIAVAFVDKNTDLGAKYLAKKSESVFYQEAEFYSTEDIIRIMKKAGFTDIRTYQTLTDSSLSYAEQPSEGYGKGGFAAVTGMKP